VAGLLIEFGRCGTSARFLVDLFLCNGLSARLITAACHTAAEVWYQGRWILTDTSLFPPGVYPVDEDGSPISLDQVVNAPNLLDCCPSYINYHYEYIDAFLKDYPETEQVIGHYLQSPILPSSAYFGEEYFEGRLPGLIERISKQGSLSSWNSDKNFGWSFEYKKENLQGLCLSSRFRPSQISHVYIKENNLYWEKPFVNSKNSLTLSYKLVVSQKTREWSYDNLRVGSNFRINGEFLRTEETEISLHRLLSLGRYLTIYVEVNEWQRDKIFYLPSQEFDLVNLHKCS